MNRLKFAELILVIVTASVNAVKSVFKFAEYLVTQKKKTGEDFSPVF